MLVDPEHGTMDSPQHPGQVRIEPGASQALARLTAAGYEVVIVSNQPSAAKGKTTKENLDLVHAAVLKDIQADGGRILKSYICFHRSEDRCLCRKPGTGLLQQAFKENSQFVPSQSWMVGDGLTDVQAGQAFGTQTVFLGARKLDSQRLFDKNSVQPTLWLNDLAEFVDVLLKINKKESPVTKSFTETYLEESAQILNDLNSSDIESLCEGLAGVRDQGGRLFILGVGGSAGHASHAVNDFRKICEFEAYAPTDNVSELTARVNDEGWDTCFSNWLEGSRLSSRDAVLVFSVGGGSREKNVSVNLVKALDTAKVKGAKIFGIVGKDGGYTKKMANACVLVPVVSPDRITPHTEGFCAVIWHLVVSHPKLNTVPTKWESFSPAELVKK